MANPKEVGRKGVKEYCSTTRHRLGFPEEQFCGISDGGAKRRGCTMSTICYPYNNNSFAVEDWKTVGVSAHGIFTSTVPIKRAPKKLVTFVWSALFSSRKRRSRTTPSQKYRVAIDSLFEHSMTRREVAYFSREVASQFVPLTSEQTRLLPPREVGRPHRRTMPPLLQPAEFLPSDLNLVAGFDCGSQPWEAAMSEWIKQPPTALFGNSTYETSIWLYYHQDGRIVGFGSLGLTRWTDPYPDGPWRDLSIIPALAIQTEFQQLPRRR